MRQKQNFSRHAVLKKRSHETDVVCYMLSPVVVNPDLNPFFCGTAFPKKTKQPKQVKSFFWLLETEGVTIGSPLSARDSDAFGG